MSCQPVDPETLSPQWFSRKPLWRYRFVGRPRGTLYHGTNNKGLDTIRQKGILEPQPHGDERRLYFASFPGHALEFSSTGTDNSPAILLEVPVSSLENQHDIFLDLAEIELTGRPAFYITTQQIPLSSVKVNLLTAEDRLDILLGEQSRLKQLNILCYRLSRSEIVSRILEYGQARKEGG